jgi:hypothetical protein
MNAFKMTLLTTALVFSCGTFASAICPVTDSESAFSKVDSLLEVIETQSKVSFSGEITKYSIDRLIKNLDRTIKKQSGTKQEITINLDSGGGNINETIRALQYIRELNRDPLLTIHTKVSRYSSCESACTILFTAGEKRFASERSQFGFHSPKYEKGKLVNITKKEVEERYRKIWLNYVRDVDEAVALEIDHRGYLLRPEMSYMNGKSLNTGYVTDII